MKPHQHSERELQVLADVSHYAGNVKGRTQIVNHVQAEVREQVEAYCAGRPVGGTLYAVGEVGGIETTALIATYHPGTGWKEFT